jgi:hypothetical protein
MLSDGKLAEMAAVGESMTKDGNSRDILAKFDFLMRTLAHHVASAPLPDRGKEWHERLDTGIYFLQDVCAEQLGRTRGAGV